MTKQNQAAKSWLNNFFVTIAENIDKIITHKKTNYKEYLQNQFILFKTNKRGRSQLNYKANKDK